MPKVAFARCPDYDQANVYASVKKTVELLGGMHEFVKPGNKVLLKPNLLSPRPPEDAVDTHPEVVRAVARLIKEAGGVPIIGDSPGGFGNNADQVFEASGMREMADAEGIELVKFKNSKFVNGIPVSRYIFDCDCVISIPKFKTHCLTLITAGIKNMFGAITGLYKAECHSRSPREEEFAKIIAQIYSITQPDLTIIDSVVAMENDGPSSGTPRKMDLVIASRDAVAVDSCLAKLIGLEPLDVLVTKEAHLLSLGEVDIAKMELVGDDFNSFTAHDFKLPQTLPLKFIPRGIAGGIGQFVRFKPYIDQALCRRCNLCKLSCPVDAIASDEDYCKINYTTCVRCLCCHEVCPYKAIKIKRNILTKLIWG